MFGWTLLHWPLPKRLTTPQSARGRDTTSTNTRHTRAQANLQIAYSTTHRRAINTDTPAATAQVCVHESVGVNGDMKQGWSCSHAATPPDVRQALQRHLQYAELF